MTMLSSTVDWLFERASASQLREADRLEAEAEALQARAARLRERAASNRALVNFTERARDR